MPFEHVHTRARRGVPDPHLVIFSPRRHACAIGTDREAFYLLAVMPLQLQHYLARHSARDLDGTVIARRRDAVSGIARALEAADSSHWTRMLLDLELARVELLS